MSQSEPFPLQTDAGIAEPLTRRRWRRFSRQTSSGRFIPEIDGLRFPAIAIVLVGHLCAQFTEAGLYPAPANTFERFLVRPVAQSGKGVLLFFIISGFVLALPFVRQYLAGGERVSLGQYFMRRVTRLEPPYLISLTIFLLIKIIGRSTHLTTGSSPSSLVEHYLASAAYLHNLIYGVPSAINAVAWSLEVEIQFYLLVPLLASVFIIRSALVRRTVLIAVAAVSIYFQQRLGAVPNRWAYSIAGNLHFFLLGFLLADLYVLGPTLRGATRLFRWDVVTMMAWPFLFLAQLGGFLFPVLAVVVFIAVFRGRITNRVFCHPLVTTIGGMCYSIYLLHFLLIGIFGRIVFRHIPSMGSLGLDFIVQGPLLLGIALAFSTIYYLLIERPCMDRDWPKRLADAVHRRFRIDPSRQEMQS